MSSDKRIFYSISDVVSVTGVNANKLRHWESVTSVLKPQRVQGQRRYTPKQLEVVKQLREFVEEQGMSLAAAERQIQRQRTAVDQTVLRRRLIEIGEQLDQVIERLQRVR
ncbi:MAG: MerR family transcriptional regulator [Gammaproteobacteria bacterium AqS3]|nr:MerR family transcriptional regulator [Gammaproteobacteria bacterium AqS3]